MTGLDSNDIKEILFGVFIFSIYQIVMVTWRNNNGNQSTNIPPKLY